MRSIFVICRLCGSFKKACEPLSGIIGSESYDEGHRSDNGPVDCYASEGVCVRQLKERLFATPDLALYCRSASTMRGVELAIRRSAVPKQPLRRERSGCGLPS
jgi:hypothetical protein